MIDEVIGPGLINPRNTRYVNPFVQLLFHILPLRLMIAAWPIAIQLFPHSVWCSSQCPRIGPSMLYCCLLCAGQMSLMAKIASNWPCRYSGHYIMLLRGCLGTQLNNCSVSDRSLGFLPPSHLDVFPIDLCSSYTFPFSNPLLWWNAWIFTSGLSNLMLNHLKRSKFTFVHFLGSFS
jgi:hypothetical protein